MTEPVSWRNSQVLSLLVAVFIAGGLSGAFAYRTLHIARSLSSSAASPWFHLENKETSLDALKRELDLTPDQFQKVSAIIDDYKRYYGNIQDQFEEVRATGKNRIVEVLDPAQKAKFEKLMGAAPVKTSSAK